MTDQDWRDDALCAQVDPELFFPEKGESTHPAVTLCKTCPVQAECLEYALDHPGVVGVWAGTTPKARVRLRAARDNHGPHLTHEERGRAGAIVNQARSQTRATRAVEMHGQGYADAHIAASLGVHIDSVRRYLREAARDSAA